VLLLDGPSPTAYNTTSAPDKVRIEPATAEVGTGDFSWTFPAHSVTLLELSRQPPEFLAAGGSGATLGADATGSRPTAGVQISS